MKRLIIVGALLAALIIPASASAQDDAEASEAPIGMTTFDVCLAISGPVIQITPEALTEGITDGTFVIEGLSNQCDDGLQAPDDDMDDSDDMDDMDDSDGSDDSDDDMDDMSEEESS